MNIDPIELSKKNSTSANVASHSVWIEHEAKASSLANTLTIMCICYQ